jgi:archaellum component FlaC
MLNINEQSKQAYRQKIQAQIKELKGQKQVLQAKVEKSSADMRIAYQKRMDDLQDQFDELEGRFNQLSNAAEDSWGEIRTGIEKSLEDLRNAVDNAAKKIKA